jgi:hypothetical protein
MQYKESLHMVSVWQRVCVRPRDVDIFTSQSLHTPSKTGAARHSCDMTNTSSITTSDLPPASARQPNTNMTLGNGILDLRQDASEQQNGYSHTNMKTKSLLAGKTDQDKSNHPEHALSMPRPHRRISTSTAYVEDTNSMVGRFPPEFISRTYV